MEYCHGVGVRLAHLLARELGAGTQILRALKQGLDPDIVESRETGPGPWGATCAKLSSSGGRNVLNVPVISGVLANASDPHARVPCRPIDAIGHQTGVCTVQLFSSACSPEWLVPKCGIVQDLTDIIPIEHFAMIIRHHELGGPTPFHRKLLRVLLPAVGQHLPIAVETSGVTVSSPIGQTRLSSGMIYGHESFLPFNRGSSDAPHRLESPLTLTL